MERLEGRVQPYPWGDTTTLANLLGRAPTGEPQAELWMGAHDRAPSRVVSSGERDGNQTLAALIESDPEHHLGADLANRYGELPYLFKVLAIGQHLSVQVHPTLEQAKAGFACENDAGIDIAAPHRTYRDANHKPELIVALTRLEALCGFRDLAQTREFISELNAERSDVDELVELGRRINGDGSPSKVLADTVGWLLGLDAEAARSLVGSLRRSLDHVQTSVEFVGAASAIMHLAAAAPDDPGVAVGLLLNHVVLEPGEGFFMAAGNLHAYIHGVGVELMANSDNVVRGGLTPKHVAIHELMQVCSFEPEDAPVQTCDSALHTYRSPVDEFALTRVVFDGDPVQIDRAGPRIVLMTEGFATLQTATDSDRVERGAISFVSDADGPLTVTGHGVAWIAGPG